MKKLPYGKLISIAIFLIAFFIISSDDIVAYLRNYMGEGIGGMLTFITLLILAVVLAPVTVVPLIPLASSLFGAFVTGILSIIGWTLGGVIAFFLARYVGRPVLRYFISLEKVDELEKKFSRTDEFVSLILLRMIVPVDILSYAVGVFTTLPLRTYALATAIGVAPFSFIFSYGGQALADRSYLTLIGIALFGGLLFFFVARYFRRMPKDNKSSS